jgi:hypothetical protein
MVGNDDLRKRFVAPENDIASVLALKSKFGFQECGYALAA